MTPKGTSDESLKKVGKFYVPTCPVFADLATMGKVAEVVDTCL